MDYINSFAHFLENKGGEYDHFINSPRMPFDRSGTLLGSLFYTYSPNTINKYFHSCLEPGSNISKRFLFFFELL